MSLNTTQMSGVSHQIRATGKPLPITHFTHRHPLHQISNHQIPPKTLCSGCKLESTQTMYACQRCKFFLHKSCAILPKHITHPSHKGCTLFLLTVGGTFRCDQCNQRSQGWSYHCTPCNYDMHLNCPSQQTPVTSAPLDRWTTATSHVHPYQPMHFPKTSPAHYNVTRQIPVNVIDLDQINGSQPPIISFTHPHPLHPTPINEILPTALCTGCRLRSSATMYICKPCNFILHQSCANLPEQITHPSHIGCTLSLLTLGGIFHCDECCYSGKGWRYNCGHCDYDLHVNCASQDQTNHMVKRTYSFPMEATTQINPNHWHATSTDPQYYLNQSTSSNIMTPPPMVDQHPTLGADMFSSVVKELMEGAIQGFGKNLIEDALNS